MFPFFESVAKPTLSRPKESLLCCFRMWFNAGVGLIGVTLAIALFLIVWLSLVKKVHSDDWEKRHPTAIPVATASFFLGSVW